MVRLICLDPNAVTPSIIAKTQCMGSFIYSKKRSLFFHTLAVFSEEQQFLLPIDITKRVNNAENGPPKPGRMPLRYADNPLTGSGLFS